MAINQILPFGHGPGANVLEHAAYAELEVRAGGFASGIARSIEVNTPMRHASFVAAMIGEFIAKHANEDVLDNGDLSALQAHFSDALFRAVRDEIAKATAGRVAYFCGNRAPSGWLVADGSAVSVQAYAHLDRAIYVGDANNASAPWGYRCNDMASPAASRSIVGSHIVLPDLRGEFARGWSDQRAVDAQRAFGSGQSGTVRSFDGGTTVAVVEERSASPGTGAAQADLGLDLVPSAADYPRARFAQNSATDSPIFNGPEVGWGVMRPRNVALLACIKH